MPDLSDVEASLVAAVGLACYPSGVPAGDAPLSPLVGAPVRVRRGWPDAARLDADLKAGVVNATVFALPGMSRVTTRYPRQWQVAVPPLVTLTATLAGAAVTFAGSPGAAQLAGVRIGTRSWVAPVSPADGPAQAAAALAALVPGASASGAALTLPTSVDVAVRVGGFARLSRELRRQEQHFRLTLWCPTPALRDAAASAVDAALAGEDSLALPDEACGRLTYVGSLEDDVPSKADLWRRDLRYCVEYPTTEAATAPCMLFGIRFDPADGTTVVV